MKCYQCGGEYQEKRGRLQLKDKWIGAYAVDAVHYYECDTCGDLLLPPETTKIFESRREEILNSWIEGQPLDSFLSAAQTATLLGISRQALHKHIRIRRGFIYQTKFYRRIVYLRKSVLLFKKTGDGRFSLTAPSESATLALDAGYQSFGPTKGISVFRSSGQLKTPQVLFHPTQLTNIPDEDYHHV
jgi:hypothetical protein